MFDLFRKESPMVQLYGKLPIAKDYLRVGASKGPALQLRDWLDAAFSTRAAAAAAEGRPVLAWPMRYLLGAVQGDPLLGVVRPSTDLGGERPFPFTAFVDRRRRALASALDEALLRFPMIWAELEACHASHADYGDGESFLTAMRGREIEVNVPLSPTPRRVPWSAWVHALWPDEGQEGLIKALVAISQLRAQRGPLLIRLPLVSDVDALSQAHAWWSALVTLGLLKVGDLPSLFLPGPNADPSEPWYCLFALGPLTIEAAAWLAPAAGRSALGPGDFARNRQAQLGHAEAIPESLPSLADSMRGALATARART